ncbi:MAG: NADH-quinone oxidoreductase subunit M, partial [Candidatus Omnitrophota bacterium]
TFQRVFLGKLNEKYRNLPEINGREMLTLVPLAVIVIAVGIYPKLVLDLLNTSLTALSHAAESWSLAGL